MLKRPYKAVAVLCCLMLLAAQGCSFIEGHKKTVIGAGAGAVVGGVVGGVAKGKKGAVIGALAGALAGGLIGAYLDHKDKPAKETKETYNYKAAEGTRVELAGVAADPNAVSPGGKVYLQATYAVMAPNDQQELPVVETRLVTLGNTTVAELTSNVNRAPGTYTSQVPINLKADATRGRYELTITVAAGGITRKRSSFFVVN